MHDIAEYDLADVVWFQEGPGILAKDFREEGVPLVRLAGLGGHEVSLDGCNYVDPGMVACKWRQFQLEPGDVCISTSASFGRPAVVRNQAVGAIFYTGIIRFRPASPLIDENYLKLFLGSRAFFLQAEAMASGSVIRHFGPSHIRRMKIALPPRSAQLQIAEFANALDDKIELNRRMNETLEAMAQAVFRDWFVDFGPTRRKLAGITDPIEIMGGLTPDPIRATELAALFPAALGDNGLPEGWADTTLEATAQRAGGIIQTGPFGSQLHQSDYTAEGVPVIMPANLTYSEIIEDGIARVSQDTADGLGRHKLEAGDIVYGRRGDIGRKALVTHDHSGWLCGTGCLRVSVRTDDAPPSFLFLALEQQDEWLRGRAVGATMPNLNTSLLGSIPILSPGAPVASSFEAIASVLHKLIASARQESRALAATRDLLLPKLMSGEIRLGEAERIAEAAK